MQLEQGKVTSGAIVEPVLMSGGIRAKLNLLNVIMACPLCEELMNPERALWVQSEQFELLLPWETLGVMLEWLGTAWNLQQEFAQVLFSIFLPAARSRAHLFNQIKSNQA